MRIAHISDVHIRLKERHDEYEEVFNRLYKELKNQKPDRILLTGDIVHSKITLSPELVSLTVKFFRNLSMLAPLDIIVGNHDMNMSNLDRMDSLSPIVDAAEDPDREYEINYMLDSELYEFADGFVYGVYSLADGGDIHLRKKDKKDGHVYIALYHGAVSGCKLDNDYVFSDSSTSMATFNNFDFVMLGDIHKRQFLDEAERMAYPGSLIQQNFGEEIGKGFLMWDIKSADDYSCEFVKIHNDYAYYTIEADDGILPDLDLPSKTRIRVRWGMKAQDMSRAEASRLNSEIRSKYNPLSVQLTFKPIGSTGIGEVEVDDSINLADPAVQADLLRQWIDNLDEPVNLDEIMKIDKQVTETVTNSEFEDFSNSKWHIKKVTMDNFMSYEGPIELDFESMRGTVGLFGDNTAGKSVIIDAILYALFNKTTREVKNEDLINKYTDPEVCRVKLHIVIKGIEYEIDRWTTRQYQKRTGRFINARTDVTLNRRYNEGDEWENLTETTRNESEKIIRNAVGSFDDFLITTLSTQGGNTEFLKLKPSPRADVMLRFLGLDVFNRKYDYAKDILKQIENERRSYDMDNEVELLDTKKRQKETNEREAKRLKKKLADMDKEITSIRNDISKHRQAINQTISQEKDAPTLKDELAVVEKEIKDLKKKRKVVEAKMRTLLENIEDLENTYLVPAEEMVELGVFRDRADKLRKKIKQNKVEIESNKRVLRIYKQDLDKENKCPVMDDTRHTTCAYLKGYIVKKDECMTLIGEVGHLQSNNDIFQVELDSIEYVYDVIEEQEQIQEHLTKAIGKLNGFKQTKTELTNALEVKEISVALITSQLKIAENNDETIRKNKDHRTAIKSLEETLVDSVQGSKVVEDSRDKITTKVGVLSKEIETIEDTLDKIRNSDERYQLFNVYCNAMHRKGLPVDVLKGYIPKINYEINKILSDVVNFGLFLKIDAGETDIDIVMRYDGEEDDTRPAQMASGMEKLLINMAIRYALLSVSNLNTPSSWFIDEGFGVLDSENLFAMSQFFDNVKGVFRTIVIITHIDTLKDVADWVINIEKKGGISQVNPPVKNI